jgi:queuine tRNA-ribosyltransferase
MISFELGTSDPNSQARTGKITTDHGIITTPIFMPVGTAGTVKAVHQRELIHDIQAQIILGNTYHLYMRPGMETIANAGGLHRFMGWDGPLLTDSGGYQVYSLADSRKITEEGVSFKSHIDGSRHNFTPEYAIDIQQTIGADIVMAFDECTPFPCDHTYAKNSMDLTHRWLARCKTQFQTKSGSYGHSQSLFGIVQGSVYPELRKQSAEAVAEMDLPGNAIGGLSVGEPAEIMYEMTRTCSEILPGNKPRYLMGVGTPANLLECVSLGIDMFDCVMPTRNARNGMLFTTQGIINIRNQKWKNDFTAIDKPLQGYAGGQHSKAYLRHLIHSNEILGSQISSLQNLTFYCWLMGEIRNKIEIGSFNSWRGPMAEKLMQRL